MKHLVLFFLITKTFYINAFASNDSIRIVGSSTAYQYITSYAEDYHRYNPKTNLIIENTGTGIGFKLFCSKNENSPEIIMASRKIKQEELDECTHNVGKIIEINFGFDGVVIVTSKKNKISNLNREEIFRAISKYRLVKDNLFVNKTANWADINHRLPDMPIKIYGPSTSSGTREEINRFILEYECRKHQNKINEAEHEKLCTQIRRDGAYAEVGKNENLVITKVNQNTSALGFTGYNFYIQNTERTKALKIDNIAPTQNNLASMSYPLSRPLYVYAKQDYIKGPDTSVKKFLQRLINRNMIGYSGYLQTKGLIPLSQNRIDIERDKLD